MGYSLYFQESKPHLIARNRLCAETVNKKYRRLQTLKLWHNMSRKGAKGSPDIGGYYER